MITERGKTILGKYMAGQNESTFSYLAIGIGAIPAFDAQVSTADTGFGPGWWKPESNGWSSLRRNHSRRNLHHGKLLMKAYKRTRGDNVTIYYKTFGDIWYLYFTPEIGSRKGNQWVLMSKEHVEQVKNMERFSPVEITEEELTLGVFQ